MVVDLTSTTGVAHPFELAIAEHATRGYRLRDWRFVATYRPATYQDDAIVETIIAVFERIGWTQERDGWIRRG